jgi:hypothetical protein
MPEPTPTNPLRTALLRLLSDDRAPPEVAAAGADLYAATERYNMLAMFAHGLYERLHGPPRVMPVFEGATVEFFRATGAMLVGHTRHIFELSERGAGYDEMHTAIFACLADLSAALAPHFPTPYATSAPTNPH